MNIKDIHVGEEYYIEYVDDRCPCKCVCHSDKNVLHVVPCCYDRSYSGTGIVKSIHIDENYKTLIYVEKPSKNTARYSPDRFIRKISKENNK